MIRRRNGRGLASSVWYVWLCPNISVHATLGLRGRWTGPTHAAGDKCGAADERSQVSSALPRGGKFSHVFSTPTAGTYRAATTFRNDNRDNRHPEPPSFELFPFDRVILILMYTSRRSDPFTPPEHNNIYDRLTIIIIIIGLVVRLNDKSHTCFIVVPRKRNNETKPC